MADLAILGRLTNKVGPLPAWAWAAIPATAYVAYSYWKASQGEGVIADVEPGVETTPLDEYGLNTGGSSLPSYGATPNGSSNLPYVEAPKPDNETWFRQASNFLVGEGVIPSDAIIALNAYLYGSPEEITTRQMDALQRAIIKFGAAPTPAFTPKVKPDTPTQSAGPGMPRNLNATISGSTLTAFWNSPIGGGSTGHGPADAYLVRIYDVTQGESLLMSLETTSTTVQTPGITPGRAYWVGVRAKSNAGGLSDEAQKYIRA